MARSRLVRGREQELAVLRADGWRSSGQGKLLLVRGPTGIGRTAVLTAAARAWQADGVLVVRVPTAREDREGVDRYGVTAILTGLRAHFEQLAGSAALRLVAELTGLDGQELSPRAVLLLRQLFDEITATGPVALLVDDACEIAEPAPALAVARDRGCLVVAAWRADRATTPAAADLLTLADEVVEVTPLPAEQLDAIMVRDIGQPLDLNLRVALRAALGPLAGNPGAALATVRDLLRRGRLVDVYGQLCLADPERPIGLPVTHHLVVGAGQRGNLAIRLLAVVGALDELDVAELPALTGAIGGDLDTCGQLLDQLVDDGALVVGEFGRVRCVCAALAATALELAGGQRRLFGKVSSTALGRGGLGPDTLAEVLALAAGADRAAAGWLVERAREVELERPDRALRWYTAALAALPASVPLGDLLRLTVRVGAYDWMYRVDWTPLRRYLGAARTELRLAAVLADVHTGWRLPAATRAAAGLPAKPGPDTWLRGDHGLAAAPELRRAAQALAGQLTMPQDALFEAGRIGDLATVLEIVLGERYQVPVTGPVAAYQRLVRCYAAGDWSVALSAVRELELTSASDDLARQAGRLFATEMCLERGERDQAARWFAGVPVDTPLFALRTWADRGILLCDGKPYLLPWFAFVLRRSHEDPALIGVDQAMSRAIWAAVSQDDLPAAAELLDQLEHHCLGRRAPGEPNGLLIARSLVHRDSAEAQAAVEAARARGSVPELLTACLVAAEVADDPQPLLREAYQLAQRCGASAVSRQLRQRVRGHRAIRPQGRPAAARLSALEQRIVDLIRRGHTNRQIASVLLISEKTVEAHLTRLLAKTGRRSRIELVAADLDGLPG